MIAADGEGTALFYRAVHIEDVVSRATTNIDDERAEVFLMLRQHNLRGSERTENDVLHFER